MANYYGAPSPSAQQYGGVAPPPTFKPRMRRPNRLNFAAICLSLFVPWLLFCFMYAVMSFSLHHSDKLACYVLVALGLLIVMVICKLAVDSMQKHHYSDDGADPNWFLFLAIACLIAWVSGVALGDLNYFYNLEPYYELLTMNSYPSVDPSTSRGQQMMDAGQITFVPESKLDLQKSMAFRNGDTYCVAPIINNQSKADITSYDFWAVGLNCCDGLFGQFACGEWNNRHAASGLRVMRRDQSEFYLLAVSQAVANFGIKARHPLFVYWLQDPTTEMAAYGDEGMRYYLFGAFTFFAFMLFFILVAMVIFSNLS